MQTFRVIQNNKRASFLVKAKEIQETNGVISSIKGSYRMTSYDGKGISKTSLLGEKLESGLFFAEQYTFKPVKTKSI